MTASISEISPPSPRRALAVLAVLALVILTVGCEREGYREDIRAGRVGAVFNAFTAAGQMTVNAGFCESRPCGA